MSKDVFAVVGEGEFDETLTTLVFGYFLCSFVAFVSWAVLTPSLALVVSVALFAVFRLFLMFFALVSNRILNNRMSALWVVAVLGQMLERQTSSGTVMNLPEAMLLADEGFKAELRPRRTKGNILAELGIDVVLIVLSALLGLMATPWLRLGLEVFVGSVISYYASW